LSLFFLLRDFVSRNSLLGLNIKFFPTNIYTTSYS
jgi:hypothetical protein